VDLADFPHTSRAGRVAEWHTGPEDLDVLFEGRGCALNTLFHLDPNTPGPTLEKVNRLACRLCELLLTPDGDAVGTTADRLDGRTGSVDLLVIQEATATRS
jgi:hypothetical protein